MREVVCLNHKWLFGKDVDTLPEKIPASWNWVNLPHTWNAIDGQDGGNDYFRGKCLYVKTLESEDVPQAEKYYLEFKGANSEAEVYVNGVKVGEHQGGYSTFRVNITDHMKSPVTIAVGVSNAPHDEVYPQSADFTFYGGLYRDVNLICVPESHFDLDYYGSPGLQITPQIDGTTAHVRVESYVTNLKANQEIEIMFSDNQGYTVANNISRSTDTTLDISDVHLWNGIKDPYLYTATVRLLQNGKILDQVSSHFGCRTFDIDPNKGFILNGKPYPLRGVSRHQDRWGIGNALTKVHHEEDMAIVKELGATTLRLAHYQQDGYFYHLCDDAGIVVWAEIPYISKHLKAGDKNTEQQLTELIVQNYNHPSIVVWGISNEITLGGSDDPDLLSNHRRLNQLAHKLDQTRKTTMACLTMCKTDSDILHIPDVLSYNHYFGWYGGDTSMNGPWFDAFHKKHPNIPIGCSEYGCEALNWHTSQPTQGDYTEEYQAYYHEELIKQLYSRPYLWATHVWNLFDFGADARNEGGENGQNHKGLVTFDRTYKKDAFYAYKAWLSDVPFVHICGKRYVKRTEDVTRVKVYSNQPNVELFANGKSLGIKTAPDHFFVFDVPNVGVTKLVAVAGEERDEARLEKVETFYEPYRLKEKGAVLNWFDIEAPDGYFSLNDKVSDLVENKAGQALFATLTEQMMSGNMSPAGFELTPELMQMMGGFTLLRLTGLMATAGVNFTKEQLLDLNEKLNQIPKG